MGTKVYRESYLPGYHYQSVRNTNEIPTNSNWPLFYGNKAIQNGQHRKGILPGAVTNLFSGYEKESLKQMMLTHEAAFKHQLSELHRLYKVQKEIMNEIKRMELYKHHIQIDTPPSSSSLVHRMPYEDALMRWHKSPLPIRDSSDCAVLEFRPSKARKCLFDLHLTADNYIDVEEETTVPESKISGILSNSCTRYDKAGLGISATIGSSKVQFFDLNAPFRDDDVDVASSTDVLQKNDNGREHIVYMNGAGPQHELPKNTHVLYPQSSEVGQNISRHNRNLHSSPASDPSIGKGLSNINGILREPKFIPASVDMKSPRDFALNTTILKLLSNDIPKVNGGCNNEGINSRGDTNSSHTTQKPGSAYGPTFSHNRIPDFPISDSIPNTENKVGLIDINLLYEVDSEVAETENNKRTAGYGVHIDLNLCAVEEDEIAIAPSCASTSADVKIALNINLEVPILADLEENTSSSHKDKQHCKEADTFAAMALVEISTFLHIAHFEENNSWENSSEDALLWFSKIASSHSETSERNSENASNEIDEFEAMTLRLTELTEEEYMPKPLVFENMELEMENNPSAGRSRRGRKKRDFQRDILPGMTSLSRHEVAEDVHTFGRIMKAMGHSFAKKIGGGRRGRPRLVADMATPFVEPKVTYKPFMEEVKSVEIGFGGKGFNRMGRDSSSA